MEAHYNEPVSLFENRITMDTELQKEESMVSKGRIRRPVLINGVETWITASTEQEYADKLITLALGSVTSNIPGQHNFREYAWMWFETYSKPNIAEVTAISYKRQLERHILPVLGDLNIEDIKPAHVQLVFNRIGSDATQETKKKAKQVLSQIFKTAINDMLITRNPLSSKSVKIHGLASEKTKTYSIEQMRYLLEHVGEIKNEFDRAWLALITAVPLRPEEVLGLRWRDVDEEKCEITINSVVTHPDRNKPIFKPYPKTYASRRTLAISREAMKNLPERGKPDDFVVGGSFMLSYTQVRRMCRRIAKETGFDEEITPRRFRTTLATDIADATHDLHLVQASLGHTTPAMSLKYYVKGRNTSVDAAVALAGVYERPRM